MGTGHVGHVFLEWPKNATGNRRGGRGTLLSLGVGSRKQGRVHTGGGKRAKGAKSWGGNTQPGAGWLTNHPLGAGSWE